MVTVKTTETAEYTDFLPDLCTGQAVFHLVIVGELLAIALTMAGTSIGGLSWYRFGLISMMVQWVVLASAACLCPLRSWFRRLPPEVAGVISYAIVIIVTASFSALGAIAQHGARADAGAVRSRASPDFSTILERQALLSEPSYYLY